MQKKKSLDIRIHYDLTGYIVNIWAIVKKKTHNHKLLFLQHTAIILAQVFRNSTLAFYAMFLSLLHNMLKHVTPENLQDLFFNLQVAVKSTF